MGSFCPPASSTPAKILSPVETPPAPFTPAKILLPVETRLPSTVAISDEIKMLEQERSLIYERIKHRVEERAALDKTILAKVMAAIKEKTADAVRACFPEAVDCLRRHICGDFRLEFLTPSVALCLLDFDGSDGFWIKICLAEAGFHGSSGMITAVIDHPCVTRESVTNGIGHATHQRKYGARELLQQALKTHEKWLWTARRIWVIACIRGVFRIRPAVQR